jgi:SAM-dependent methyltransferase
VTDSGGDFYDEVVAARYLAHRHSGASSPNVVMEEPAVLAQLGDLTGQRVIDLGCGDGSFAREVLARGAPSYLGVDGSDAMIAAARQRPADERVRFEVGRIEAFQPAPGTAELVTSRMALHYLRDITPTLRSAHEALTENGRLLFTVTHPVITSFDNREPGPRTNWTVDDYFDAGERRRNWFGSEVTWFHRTVEQYISAVLAAGFIVEAVSECAPDPSLLADASEELARRRRVPVILLVSALRR